MTLIPYFRVSLRWGDPLVISLVNVRHNAEDRPLKIAVMFVI